MRGHLALVGERRDIRNLGGLSAALGNRQPPRELDFGIHLSLLPVLDLIDSPCQPTAREGVAM